MAYKQNSTDLDNILAVDSEWNFQDLGKTVVFGENAGGLGFAWAGDISSPVNIPGNLKWKQIATSGTHTLGITTSGELFSWGHNSYGELGITYLSLATEQHSFVKPEVPASLVKSKWIAAANLTSGEGSSYAIGQFGGLYAWGYNNYGQLGTNNTTGYSVPTAVGTLGWIKVSANNGAAAAIREDNQLFVWGFNADGQLGKGNIISYSSPVRVGTSYWKDVAVGGSHMVAIKTDGTLWSWGYNNYGQLGLGDTNSRSSPVQIGTNNTWRAVAAGSTHSVAVKGDNKAYSFGINMYGQLGTNLSGARSSPTQVALGTATCVAVACGDNHTLLVAEHNIAESIPMIYSCGYNAMGQLGIGNTASLSSPQLITTGNYVFAGENLSFIIDAQNLEY